MYRRNLNNLQVSLISGKVKLEPSQTALDKCFACVRFRVATINDGDEVRTGSNPAGVGLIKFDTALANRMMGRIILQVESHGEAWYVNPSDGKRYYMKDGEAAYQIMRFLSLGVTDIDLQKIGSGSL